MYKRGRGNVEISFDHIYIYTHIKSLDNLKKLTQVINTHFVLFR
jgi:hypothetical protein